MPQETVAGSDFKSIVIKVAPTFFLNSVFWLIIMVIKYPLIFDEQVYWKQVWIDTFTFTFLFTIILEFKHIRMLVRLIRSGKWS